MKKLSVLLIAAMLFAACFVSPVSAADAKTGFYNIGTADGVTITAAASSGTVTEVKEDVDGDKTEDVLYNGSDKLTVKYDKATAEKYYMVWLVEGTTLPSSDPGKVYFVDQATAAGTTVTLDVTPKLPTKTMQMTLFITSDDGKATVSVPVSYLAGAASDFKIGDVNMDGNVTAKDRMILVRYLAGWDGYDKQILSWDAADIDQNGSVTAKDRMILVRYLAGWDGYDEYFK